MGVPWGGEGEGSVMGRTFSRGPGEGGPSEVFGGTQTGSKIEFFGGGGTCPRKKGGGGTVGMGWDSRGGGGTAGTGFRGAIGPSSNSAWRGGRGVGRGDNRGGRPGSWGGRPAGPGGRRGREGPPPEGREGAPGGPWGAPMEKKGHGKRPGLWKAGPGGNPVGGPRGSGAEGGGPKQTSWGGGQAGGGERDEKRPLEKLAFAAFKGTAIFWSGQAEEAGGAESHSWHGRDPSFGCKPGWASGKRGKKKTQKNKLAASFIPGGGRRMRGPGSSYQGKIGGRGWEPKIVAHPVGLVDPGGVPG